MNQLTPMEDSPRPQTAALVSPQTALDVSIVIPAYNEANRIGKTLQMALEYLAAEAMQSELIVVNDGSTDATLNVVNSFASNSLPITILNRRANRGKGFSVREGMLAASGSVALFADADASTPFEEMPKLLAAIDGGADVAIGTRWLRPELQEKPQPALRRMAGRVYNASISAMLGLHVSDTMCGFKAFRKSAAQLLFSRARVDRWGFDSELLFIAERLRMNVVEVPVRWSHAEGSKVKFPQDGLRTLADALKTRYNALTGAYGPDLR